MAGRERARDKGETPMSGNPPPGPEPEPTPRENPQPVAGLNRWDKVYFGELDEVYLLLDFIAGRPDRNVSSLEVELSEEVPDLANPGQTKLEKKKLGAPEIVKRISRLRFPQSPEPQRSEDAAFVLLVKDRLCAFAYPATAQSIAFTYFVTETTSRRSRKNSRSNPSRPRPPPSERNEETRGSVVRRVYPEFEQMANTFCRVRALVVFLTFAIAIVGAVLLAEATYGGQLAARLQAAKRDAAAAAEKVYTAYSVRLRAEEEAGRSAPLQTEARVEQLCSISNPPTTADSIIPVSGQTQMTAAPVVSNPISVGKTDVRFIQLCDDYSYSAASFNNAIDDVDAYARSWAVRLIFPWVTATHEPGTTTCKVWPDLGGHKKSIEQQNEEKTCGPRQETGPSVSVMVSGFTNLILPLIFGVVGALSAMIRRIQERITDSVLVPRDQFMLSFRIVLGVVAGGSVALFFDPLKVASEITNGNPALSVSASGIAFLAGYGAPAFFLMLDKVISRVFDFRDTHEPANGSTQAKAV
jgi:hypothetical protein